MARFIPKLVCDRHIFLPLLIAVVFPQALAISRVIPSANAQIRPDNTLPGENSVVPLGAENGTLPEVVINGGAQRDTVLFHSFEDFQVNTGQSVRFANPPLIERIFSRVTGGRISNINGLLGVDGLADLFFLNPNGVIFGPNAELDVRGSFVVTTGDRILFNDNISFSAVNPEAPPLLTITSPVGIQFGNTPGTIRARQADLSVPSGETLALLGGDIRVNNGTNLSARDGRLNLTAVSESGTVGLNLDAANPRRMVQLPEGLERASIALRNNSQGQTQGNGNGSITFYADNVTLRGSELRAGIDPDSGTVDSQGGAIVIDATGTVRLVQSVEIRNDVGENALGDGGRIVIQAERLVMRDGSTISTTTSSAGSAGNIKIQVDQLILEEGDVSNTPSQPDDGNPPPPDDNNPPPPDDGNPPPDDNNPPPPDDGNPPPDDGNPPPRPDDGNPPPRPDDGNPPPRPDDGNPPPQPDDGNPPPRPDDSNPPPRPDDGNPPPRPDDGNPPPRPDDGNPPPRPDDGNPPPRPDDGNPPPRPDDGNPPPRPDDGNPPPRPDDGNPPPRPDDGNPPPRPDDGNPPPRPDDGNPPPRPDDGNPPPPRTSRAARPLGSRNESNDSPPSNNADNPSSSVPRTIISSDARGGATGTTGNIIIDAAEIRLEGGVRIQIRNEVDNETGGNIRITRASHPLGRADSVQVLLGAQINSETRGAGSTAGNITIQATEVLLDDLGSLEDDPGGIDSTIRDEAIDAQGGTVRINAQTLTNRGGRIGTTVQGRGTGGDIIITVDDTILLTGNTVSGDRDDPQFGLGLIASAVRQPMENALPPANPDTPDRGGNIIIQARHLILENGAEIEAGAQREGFGGDITITTTDSVQLLGGDAQGKINRIATQLNEGEGSGGAIDITTERLRLEQDSHISAATLGSGNGGTIDITTEQLRLARGSQISAATLGSGNGGSIKIDANQNIVLTGSVNAGGGDNPPPRPDDGSPPSPPDNTPSPDNNESNNNGNDGPSPNSLIVIDGRSPSGIFTNSVQLNPEDIENGGDAGTITITTSNLEVSDRAQISASSTSSGDTGNIEIQSDNLTLDNSIISAEAVDGDDGNITLTVQEILQLRNGSEITAEATDDAIGGNIVIDPIAVILQGGSTISASNDSLNVNANGGNVDLTAEFLLSLPDGPNTILAQANAGRGGNIDINTFSIYGDFGGENLTNIDASSQRGIDGDVEIQTPEVDPTRSILELPSALSDANDQVRNACAPGERGRGSFAVTGRSGLSSSPLSRVSSPILIPDLGPFGLTLSTHTRLRNDSQQDALLQEAQTWDIASNGTVTLSPKPSVDDLLVQGRRAYDRGDYDGAIALWTNATEQLSNPQDSLVLASTFSNLALAYHHLGAWPQAEQALTASQSLFSVDQLAEPLTIAPVLAQMLNTKAQLSLAAGDTRGAIATWEQADAAYLQAQNPVGQIQTRLHLVQALNTLGFHDQAQAQLTRVNTVLETSVPTQDGVVTPRHAERSIAHLSSGILLQRNGHVEEARQAFQDSLAITQNLDSPTLKATLTSTVLLNLGHLEYAQAQSPTLSPARAYGKRGDALTYFREAIAAAPTPIDQLHAQLSIIEVLQQQQQTTTQRNSQLASDPQTPLWQRQATRTAPAPFTLADSLPGEDIETTWNGIDAISLLQTAQSLPLQRDSLYAQLRLAHLLIQASSFDANASGITSDQILALLHQVEQHAQQLGDRHALAYTLGYQGQLYAQAQQWPQTEGVTNLALHLSQQSQSPEMSYRWYWQLGQAYRAQGKRTNAIGAYTEAVKALKIVRSELTTTNADVQFTFRDSVEPLYRQLVQLLLQTDATSPPMSDGTVSNLPKANLEAARSLIEDLQLEELQDYFQDACLPPTSKIDTVDPKAAVIYPILLGDQLDVIISMAGDYIHYSQAVSSTKIQQTVDQLLGTLTTPFDSQLAINTQNLQQVHDWILAPAIDSLADFQPETLVFVADGPLRTLPLAALHDGEQYLIEKYNVALSPGLDLLKPQALDSEGVGVFVGGISEAHAGFTALPFVKQEVETIAAQIPDNEVLLNEQLTTTNFAAGLADSPAEILHLATHGKFGADAASTFLLMWDQQLTINDFGTLLQQRNQTALTPIELLILSACETATGDSRAVLGIAGMAVKSGVSSAIAGLWPLHDQATSLFMDEFYNALAQPGITKVDAFRQAQLALLKDPRFQAPYYWSPFVLVGNWL